jgi:hypothetical protein
VECDHCGAPRYACTCGEGLCCYCGDLLSQWELECGREECWECYVEHQS